MFRGPKTGGQPPVFSCLQASIQGRSGELGAKHGNNPAPSDR